MTHFKSNIARAYSRVWMSASVCIVRGCVCMCARVHKQSVMTRKEW